MLCSGRAQRSRPCDHYTSSCTDDPWLIWLFFSFGFVFLFHVKCIFRNKCLCFKNWFSTLPFFFHLSQAFAELPQKAFLKCLESRTICKSNLNHVRKPVLRSCSFRCESQSAKQSSKYWHLTAIGQHLSVLTVWMAARSSIYKLHIFHAYKMLVFLLFSHVQLWANWISATLKPTNHLHRRHRGLFLLCVCVWLFFFTAAPLENSSRETHYIPPPTVIICEHNVVIRRLWGLMSSTPGCGRHGGAALWVYHHGREG